MPAGVDSMCVAGLLELLRTRGLWLASVRYGYVYGGMRGAGNIVTICEGAGLWSKAAMVKVAAEFERAWSAVVKEAAAKRAEEGNAEQRAPPAAQQATELSMPAQSHASQPGLRSGRLTPLELSVPSPHSTCDESVHGKSGGACTASMGRSIRFAAVHADARAQQPGRSTSPIGSARLDGSIGDAPPAREPSPRTTPDEALGGAPSSRARGLHSLHVDDPPVVMTSLRDTMIARITPIMQQMLITTPYQLPPTISGTSEESINNLVIAAVDAFLKQDLYTATRQLLGNAKVRPHPPPPYPHLPSAPSHPPTYPHPTLFTFPISPHLRVRNVSRGPSDW